MKNIAIIVLLMSAMLIGKGENCSMDIEKKVLKNGLTVLAHQNKTVPKVSILLLYNAGSKNEETFEKGRAHLIEHMIFKGTEHILSESDIKIITHKLSGDCNAFTSYDFTGYIFNMPSQNWRAVLPIMADCMVHAAFKDEHLNSEMKAVIQELKMIRDNHLRTLAYDLLTAIFSDHPYHYPLIGYKQDLWSARGEDLKRFYKKHYIPNNATLVVVGDINPEEVFKLAEHYFGHIPPNFDYAKEQFYHNTDIISKSITLYRDIQQPIALTAYVIPGFSTKIADVTTVLSLILSDGNNSRLYKRLVDGEQLVTSVSASPLELFDFSLFLIIFSPKNVADIPRIEQIIHEELQSIVMQGLLPDELQGVLKKAKMNEYATLEQNEKQAVAIGKSMLAMQDPTYAFTYLEIAPEKLEAKLKAFITQYLRLSVMNRGLVLPLAQEDTSYWLQLQEESDAQDALVLSTHQRTEPVEPPKYAHAVEPAPATGFHFPKAVKTELENGLKIFWYDNKQTPKINLILTFKADSTFDPEDKQGLFGFVARMMTEGTKNYSGPELAHELESRGISLNIQPGIISMAFLREDLEKGLELLTEILTQPTFPEDAIQKIRSHILVELKMFWDNPNLFSGQLTDEIIYAGHPYAKNSLGTFDSVTAISRDDLVDFYSKYISPAGAACAVVGDLPTDLQTIAEETLGSWSGPDVEDLIYPELQVQEPREVNFPINRDQVTLVLARLSVAHNNPDFDKLRIFDHIFGGSLHSRLFQLREQSGLFYAISGMTTAIQGGTQPGAAFVRTIVSLDRAREAEDAIKAMMANVTDTLTEDDILHAKDAISNGLVGFFDSNAKIAQAFLFLYKFGLPADYFDQRAAQLSGITLQEIKDAVRPYMQPELYNVLRVGRV